MNTTPIKRAFTLIELLVVIAIIAILAAILFPVFAQAKLAAKKTQDLSNMKQIGTSIAIYQNDSDDVYLTPYDPCLNTSNSLTTCSGYLNGTAIAGNAAGLTNGSNSNSLEYNFLIYKLYPYTKSFDIFRNPTLSPSFLGSSTTTGVLYSSGVGAGPGGYNWGGENSYGYNAAYLSPVTTAGTYPGYSPVNSSTIPRSSGTFLFLDSSFYNVAPDVLNESGYTVTSHLITADGATESNYITTGGTYAFENNLWENAGASNWSATVSNGGTLTYAQADSLGASMFNGKLNAVFADTHAKSVNYGTAIGDICYWSTDLDGAHTACSN